MKRIFAICLMALIAFGCEDLQQGTQGGNESENGNENTTIYDVCPTEQGQE